MEELKDLILEYFKKDNKSYTINDLKKQFKIKGETQTDIFYNAISQIYILGRYGTIANHC